MTFIRKICFAIIACLIVFSFSGCSSTGKCDFCGATTKVKTYETMMGTYKYCDDCAELLNTSTDQKTSKPTVQNNTVNETEQEYSPTVIAKGRFSEGLAFAELDKRLAYISNDGEIAFYLPSQYLTGFLFHEGYAVVSTYEDPTHNYEFAKRCMYDYVANSAPYYNLISTDGDLIFEADHHYLSDAGCGKVIAADEIDDYKGTSKVITCFDLSGEALWSIDLADIPKINDDFIIQPYRDINGREYAYIVETKGTDGGDCLRIDEWGNVEEVSVFEGLGTEYVSTVLAVDNVRSMSNPRSIDLNSLETVYLDENAASYNVSSFFYSNDLILVATNPMSMNASGYKILDKYGNLIYEDIEPYTSLYGWNRWDFITGLDGTWIVKFQNDYYGVVGDSGILFEPVQSEIKHLGNNLFFIDGDAVDSSGSFQFSVEGEPFDSVIYQTEFLENSYLVDSIYHDGYSVVRDDTSYHQWHYMNDCGEMINTLADFK